jgi:hypothetical protein
MLIHRECLRRRDWQSLKISARKPISLLTKSHRGGVFPSAKPFKKSSPSVAEVSRLPAPLSHLAFRSYGLQAVGCELQVAGHWLKIQIAIAIAIAIAIGIGIESYFAR